MDNNFAGSANKDNIENIVQVKTPKSDKQNHTDVRRWASVVKAHKSILQSPEVKKLFPEKSEEKNLPDNFSESYENHEGFITRDKNIFFCQICSLDLDTVLSLANHLKTRKHEDNIIVFLKDKLPAHLHHTLEFVSFCVSNLCCNLCEETISMTVNPYETILNIVAHNSDTTHTSLKASHDEHNLAHTLLNSLSMAHPEIRESVIFVEKSMIPHYKCKPCNKSIPYSEKLDVLAKNFNSHFKSVGHVKNQKAVEILKTFYEVSVLGKEKFFVMNGYIVCSLCDDELDTDIEKLMLHVKGVKHTSNSLAGLTLFSANSEEVNTTGQEIEISVEKSYQYTKSNVTELKNEKIESKEDVGPGSKLKRLINTLPPELRVIDYLIENVKGSVTCLVCDCIVPPCKNNLLMHLNGNNHQQKIKLNKIPALEGIDSKKIEKSESRELSHKCLKSVQKPLPCSLSNVNSILEHSRGDTECWVSQCKLPLNPGVIEKHLDSKEHKKLKIKQLTKCPSCPRQSAKDYSDILKLYKGIRVYRCRNAGTISSSFNDVFTKLLEKNTVISNNEAFLVKNVDGKHCYCKLCKSLISLSLDLSELENNIISHLQGTKHILNGFRNLKKTFEELKSNPQPSSTGKVVRSLFVLSSSDSKSLTNSEVNVCEATPNAKELNTTDTSPVTSPKRKPSGFEESYKNSLKNVDSEVFIFGQSEKNEHYNLKNSQKSQKVSKTTKEIRVLPVSRALRFPKFELETDVAVLNRRQKQIDYGKNTEGYARYKAVVPIGKRGRRHPMTPPKHLKYSRRMWDGAVRVWRRQLHCWDLSPNPSFSVDHDIKTLPQSPP